MSYFQHPNPMPDDLPVHLDQWRILRVKDVSSDTAADVLVGREFSRAEDRLSGLFGLGRVGTRLIELDLQRGIARTQSGRVYALGNTGFDEDSEFVFQTKFRNCIEHGLLVVTDVTAELLAGGEITP